MITNSIRLLVLASCVVTATAFTNLQASEGKGTVNLMATLRDAPAFTPVEWTVLRMDNTPIRSSHAHSLSFSIDPGTYKAIAVYNGSQRVERVKVFTVPVHGLANVVLAMD